MNPSDVTRRLVVLFDVDNTLVDDDRVEDDLSARSAPQGLGQ
jgi:FMN phosphatase YigB (HAD superfamily)